MHSGNDSRWYSHLLVYMNVSSIANLEIINDQICNYMLMS